MLRSFGWMMAGGILLGSTSLANAQAPQAPDIPAANTTGSPVPGAYGDPVMAALGTPPYFGPLGAPERVVPVVGSCKTCYTLYPLRTIYPYSYTGPGSAFGAYSYVPYPYAPTGYGWYGEYWRGW